MAYRYFKKLYLLYIYIYIKVNYRMDFNYLFIDKANLMQ